MKRVLITVATAGTLAAVAACSSGAASQSVNTPTRTVTATVTHQAPPTPSTTAASTTAATHTSAPQTSARPVQPTVTAPPTSPNAVPSSQGAVSSAAPQAVIYSCDRQPVARPAGLVLSCADAGAALQSLNWSDWGGPTATATGQLRENTCIPNCAAGGTASYPATVTASGLTGGRYTSLHLSAPSAPDPSSDFRLALNGPVAVPSR